MVEFMMIRDIKWRIKVKVKVEKENEKLSYQKELIMKVKKNRWDKYRK